MAVLVTNPVGCRGQSVVCLDRLVISREVLERFVKAYTSGITVEERRNHLVSPLYKDFSIRSKRTVKLPLALFLYRTKDPLLDDTLLIGTK